LKVATIPFIIVACSQIVAWLKFFLTSLFHWRNFSPRLLGLVNVAWKKYNTWAAIQDNDDSYIRQLQHALHTIFAVVANQTGMSAILKTIAACTVHTIIFLIGFQFFDSAIYQLSSAGSAITTSSIPCM